MRGFWEKMCTAVLALCLLMPMLTANAAIELEPQAAFKMEPATFENAPDAEKVIDFGVLYIMSMSRTPKDVPAAAPCFFCEEQ